LELVETEAELEAEDAEEEDPETPDRVLGATHFDLQSLVEDELILVLPYVPKHKVCPSLPKALETAEGSDTRRPSPFSVLAELKKDRSNRSHHGRSAKQEKSVEARHAPFARLSDHAPHGNRADHGRTAPASPHQPQRLLSRPQGSEDQERRVIPSRNIRARQGFPPRCPR